MTNKLILPEPNAVLPAFVTQRDAFLAELATLNPANSVEDVNALNAALMKAGGIIKQVDAYRKQYTKPLDDFKKLCMAQEAELIGPIDEACSFIKQELAEYRARIDAEHRARERARIAAEEARTLETAGSGHVTPALVVSEPVPEVAAVSTRKTAKLVVTNRSAIPHQFFDLNEKRLLDWLKESPVNACLGAHYILVESVVTPRSFVAP